MKCFTLIVDCVILIVDCKLCIILILNVREEGGVEHSIFKDGQANFNDMVKLGDDRVS